jgi:hypothetical protein
MNEKDKIWFPFVAGGLGDAMACLVSHPMDVAKVRLQLKGELSSIPQPKGIRNIFETVKSIYLTDGVKKGIYCGLSAAILRQLTFSSLRHGIFGFIQNSWIEKYQTPMPLGVQIISGAFIGAICACIANPCDVVLIRMQADGHWPVTQRRNYRNVLHGFHSILQTEGYKCLWRGWNATMIRGILVTCSQLPAYHTSKYYLVRSGYFSQNETSTHLLSSVVSAIVASLVTCPADVIKTRLMNMKKTPSAQHPQQHSIVYGGMMDCLIRIYRTEGLRGFYKGLGATIGRLGPHTIVLWQFQELIMKSLRNSSF